ncbi:helix-turn-helix domain-containing protein [Mycobacteroides abscessus]|uniref:helix-turn-helix domain-containing protein n=1 Tax=Mycobacteroides abscessus TaxID=36809 RepID=UPI00266CCDB6|nr:helix-turn-helix transcriptional regulator [Mycobacteroides abscessus]MDO3331337.1 helix-turn-helix transcriptional regulator [Mycobacteroides abscessus subsp. abscessus]
MSEEAGSGMENLFELVRRTLKDKDVRQEDFAEQLGVKRQQLTQWARSVPSAPTLRAIARVLEVPYGQVVAAALRSGGYVDDFSDVLTGLPVHVVVRSPAFGYDLDEDDDGVAVFSDGAAAERFRHVSDQVRRGSFEMTGAVVDAARSPEHVVVYSTVWEHIGGFEQSEELYPKVPDELVGREVTAVRAGVLAYPYGVFELRALSMDKDAGLSAVQKALDKVKARDEVLPSHIQGPGFIQRAAALEWASIARAEYRPAPEAGDNSGVAGAALPPLSSLLSLWPESVAKTAAAEGLSTTGQQRALSTGLQSAFGFSPANFLGINTSPITPLRAPHEQIEDRMARMPLVRYVTVDSGESGDEQ